MDEKYYDSDAVKDWLLRYVETEKEIDDEIERYDALVMKIESVGAQVITDMPRSSSPTQHRMDDMIGQKDELDRRIRWLTNRQSERRKLIEDVLHHIRDSQEKTVIRAHYIDGHKWPEVRDILFARKADYDLKVETYLRRAHRIHGSALVSMARYIEESGRIDIFNL